MPRWLNNPLPGVVVLGHNDVQQVIASCFFNIHLIITLLRPRTGALRPNLISSPILNLFSDD